MKTSRSIRRNWSFWAIEQELKPIIHELGRMPSANELRECGLNSLAVIISRRRGFRWWAEYLGCELSWTETHRGQDVEDQVELFLEGEGLFVERMRTRAPYDLFVHGAVRVDVKSSVYHDYGRVKGYLFGLAKKVPTCDLYILCGVNRGDNSIRWKFYVPAEEARVKMITISSITHGKFIRFFEDINQLMCRC
jgi:hypothetical protein